MQATSVTQAISLTDVLAALAKYSAVPAFLAVIYAIRKDRTRAARTRLAIETARNRMAFWDTRLKILLSTLDENSLAAAKAEALAAAEDITQRANRELDLLNGSGAKHDGLPFWR